MATDPNEVKTQIGNVLKFRRVLIQVLKKQIEQLDFDVEALQRLLQDIPLNIVSLNEYLRQIKLYGNGDGGTLAKAVWDFWRSDPTTNEEAYQIAQMYEQAKKDAPGKFKQMINTAENILSTFIQNNLLSNSNSTALNDAFSNNFSTWTQWLNSQGFSDTSKQDTLLFNEEDPFNVFKLLDSSLPVGYLEFIMVRSILRNNVDNVEVNDNDIVQVDGQDAYKQSIWSISGDKIEAESVSHEIERLKEFTEDLFVKDPLIASIGSNAFTDFNTGSDVEKYNQEQDPVRLLNLYRYILNELAQANTIDQQIFDESIEAKFATPTFLTRMSRLVRPEEETYIQRFLNSLRGDTVVSMFEPSNPISQITVQDVQSMRTETSKYILLLLKAIQEFQREYSGFRPDQSGQQMTPYRAPPIPLVMMLAAIRLFGDGSENSKKVIASIMLGVTILHGFSVFQYQKDDIVFDAKEGELYQVQKFN